jgi:hypothetical protein
MKLRAVSQTCWFLWRGRLWVKIGPVDGASWHDRQHMTSFMGCAFQGGPSRQIGQWKGRPVHFACTRSCVVKQVRCVLMM